MPALEGRRDHWPPAARRCAGDQSATVGQRPQHRLARADEAVGVLLDAQTLQGFGFQVCFRLECAHCFPRTVGAKRPGQFIAALYLGCVRGRAGNGGECIERVPGYTAIHESPGSFVGASPLAPTEKWSSGVLSSLRPPAHGPRTKLNVPTTTAQSRLPPTP
ncbi:hypothetical protein D3C73_1046910 [compost metagenome]